MGWGSGIDVAEELWFKLKKIVPKKDHKKVAKIIVEAVENHDCDTVCDCEELCKLAHDHHDED